MIRRNMIYIHQVKFQHILLREKVNYLIVIKKLAEGFEVNESFLHCFFPIYLLMY